MAEINRFKIKSVPSLFQAESLFARNNNVVYFDVHDTNISFKHVNAKRVDSVQIVCINYNLIRSAIIFF
jgi:hypothetical protein